MKVFRIYPEEWNNKFYYYAKVQLFDTREEMSKSISEYMGSENNGETQGQSSGHAHYGKNGRMTGWFATMWFNVEDLRNNPSEIISHECLHTAMRHIRNKNVDLSDMAGEEALAYCTGSMTRQVVNRLYKLKVFE
jgi:hypothetical protein